MVVGWQLEMRQDQAVSTIMAAVLTEVMVQLLIINQEQDTKLLIPATRTIQILKVHSTSMGYKANNQEDVVLLGMNRIPKDKNGRMADRESKHTMQIIKAPAMMVQKITIFCQVCSISCKNLGLIRLEVMLSWVLVCKVVSQLALLQMVVQGLQVVLEEDIRTPVIHKMV